MTPKWIYTVYQQGVIYDEKTGDTIAVVHEKKHTPKLAAAPRLYEALKFALEFLDANDDGEDDVTERIREARAALAAADGKE